MGRHDMYAEFFVGKTVGNDYFKDKKADGRMTLRWILGN
jgi:hypothetical protein